MLYLLLKKNNIDITSDPELKGMLHSVNPRIIEKRCVWKLNNVANYYIFFFAF